MTSNWKRRVIKSFDAKAELYDVHSDIQKHTAQTLAENFPDLPAQAEILEIGCGTGTLTQHLLERYAHAQFEITDISPAMIKEAQKNVPASDAVQWCVMDGENLGEGKQYDLIVSNMAFQWFEDPQTALENLKARLKPSGQILFSVPSQHAFKEWRASLDELSLQSGFIQIFQWLGIFKEKEVIINYGDTFNFLKSLKKIGAHTPTHGYKRLSPFDLKRACALNDQKHGGQTTWHILYGRIVK